MKDAPTYEVYIVSAKIYAYSFKSRERAFFYGFLSLTIVRNYEINRDFTVEPVICEEKESLERKDAISTQTEEPRRKRSEE